MSKHTTSICCRIAVGRTYLWWLWHRSHPNILRSLAVSLLSQDEATWPGLFPVVSILSLTRDNGPCSLGIQFNSVYSFTCPALDLEFESIVRSMPNSFFSFITIHLYPLHSGNTRTESTDLSPVQEHKPGSWICPGTSRENFFASNPVPVQGLSLCVGESVCLSVCLSVSLLLSVCLSLVLSVCLPLSLPLSLHLSLSLSLSLCVLFSLFLTRNTAVLYFELPIKWHNPFFVS